jgi:uncharacterized membrane protein/thiol-disulfide isomerase/thioredoxin
MKRCRPVLVVLGLVCLFSLRFGLPPARAQAALPVVHAVLFYSPHCPHCRHVIDETLPPLFKEYGNQLDILNIDVTVSTGETLFRAALKKFGLDGVGVPFLVIGNSTYLMGSVEIPAKFPVLIEDFLAHGGVDWPDIPGLEKVLPVAVNLAVTATNLPTGISDEIAPAVLVSTAPEEASGWFDNFGRDLAGSSLAVLVLAGMLAAAVWTIIFLCRAGTVPLDKRWQWLIPGLSMIGFGVAGYLSYIEMAQVSAICGPVGDCNVVQQSEYARLFGILPIGVLGLTAYLAILAAWLTARYIHGRPASLASLSIFAMTAIGTLFSMYLTLLEPFVIGATCAWCLTSAVSMTLLMLLSVRAAKAAFLEIAHGRSV